MLMFEYVSFVFVYLSCLLPHSRADSIKIWESGRAKWPNILEETLIATADMLALWGMGRQA